MEKDEYLRQLAAQTEYVKGEDWGALEYKFNYQSGVIESYHYHNDFNAKPKIKFKFSKLDTQYQYDEEVILVTNCDVKAEGFIYYLIKKCELISDMHYKAADRAEKSGDSNRASLLMSRYRKLYTLYLDLKRGVYGFAKV